MSQQEQYNTRFIPYQRAVSEAPFGVHRPSTRPTISSILVLGMKELARQAKPCQMRWWHYAPLTSHWSVPGRYQRLSKFSMVILEPPPPSSKRQLVELCIRW